MSVHIEISPEDQDKHDGFHKFELTAFRNDDGRLSKQIALADGKLRKSPAATLIKGRAKRIRCNSIADLAEIIQKMPPSEAIALGVLNDNLPDNVSVVTESALANNTRRPPNLIARTKNFLKYRNNTPALVLLDFDTGGIPDRLRQQITENGFFDTICEVVPELRSVARVTRASTSAGIYDEETGERYENSLGTHVYVLVSDGTDSERFLKTLLQRCALHGLAWHVVSKNGSLLQRSIIDSSVYGPERLCFEGPAELQSPLEQDAEARQPIAVEGGVLDTRTACPDLTPEEKSTVAAFWSAEANRLDPESSKQRAIYTREIAVQRGVTLERAQAIVEDQHHGILTHDTVLNFPDIGSVSVAEVCRNEQRFIGQTVIDPVDESGDRAKLYKRSKIDGRLCIHSFHHGGGCFILDPEPSAPESGTPEVMQLIAEMNAKHFVCTNAGRTKVYERQVGNNGERQPVVGQEAANFCLRYRNRKVKVGVGKGGAPIYHEAGDLWLDHPDRAQYEGFAFDPSGREHSQKYNLWRGFAVEQRAGSWERMKTHLHDIVCNGDDESFEYLMNYTARLVQFPAERGEVAIVMRGKEGVGKGIFANAIAHLFGRHAHHISNPKHLVGNFNSHLRDCCVLFADEAFYAGDPASVGVLKGLITEPTIPLEAKFENLIEVDNFLHVFMASNNDWIVPASIEARRFLVLDVSDAKRGDHQYFKAIVEELNNGGYEAMLYDLRHHDISDFNPRKVPQTAALNEQRIRSLSPEHKWLMEVLQRGRFRDTEADAYYQGPDDWNENFVTMDWIYASYKESAGGTGIRHPLSREHLGRLMKQIGKPVRPRDSGRKTGYSFGPLDSARRAFCEITGLDIVWEDVGDEFGG